jgi:hypothetical protein
VAGVLALALAYVGAIWLGAFGEPQRDGEPSDVARPDALVRARAAAQAGAAGSVGAPADRRILFGDLHVHTTWSLDAYLKNLPLLQGEGAHPPADACDFARWCSALDFFSLNDHAESLTPDLWRQSRDAVRACNAVGDAAAPDLVAFLGWEWTQMGRGPADHYGHKNVVLRGTADDETPARPIAASGYSFDAMRQRGGGFATLAMTLADFGDRQFYFDFGEKRRRLRSAPLCDPDAPVGELPDDCIETAATPRELFDKLDARGHEALVIPHGNAWGNTTPAGTSWDKQLRGGQHDPARQTLIEVYSGHGNSEEQRPWRAVEVAEDGSPRCPAPSEGYLPACHRAGEIIRERCLAQGVDAAECESRAAEARALYVEAGPRGEGRHAIPGAEPEDWLDAGQCTDCFQPAFDYRPGGSTQYALALTAPEEDGGPDDPRERRFRFGFVGSSDTHFARAGTGYKEVAPLGMTDMTGALGTERRGLFEPRAGKPGARAVAVDPEGRLVLPGGDTSRSASYYYTGGLVAVHAAGRDRDAIWDGLVRKEVYGTSGPRILLWFDLLNPPGAADGGAAPVPMGGEVEMAAAPHFRVRAIGSFVQQPGCPDEARRGLSPERLARLCKGECHHPSGERHPIERIEVVRIRPQRHAGERVEWLVDDPWRVLPCEGDPAGCMVEFEDPDFTSAGRDAVYYVRALQAPTPLVNAAGIACERDAEGRCTRVKRCRAGSAEGEADDDCLAPGRARAWSSPIYVDHPAHRPRAG